MTYSTDKSVPANLVTISAERVFEVIALNKNGVKPDKLEIDQKEHQAELKEFGDIIGQDSVTRFDKKKKKKGGNGGRNRQGGNGNQGERRQRGSNRQKQQGNPEGNNRPKQQQGNPEGNNRPKPKPKPKRNDAPNGNKENNAPKE